MMQREIKQELTEKVSGILKEMLAVGMLKILLASKSGDEDESPEKTAKEIDKDALTKATKIVDLVLAVREIA